MKMKKGKKTLNTFKTTRAFRNSAALAKQAGEISNQPFETDLRKRASPARSAAQWRG